MIIKKINLQNFRNYNKKAFEFSPGKNLIVGPNATGKTNVLEAIYLLATGKSLRAGVETEMIHYGEEMAKVGGGIGGKTELEIMLTTGEVLGQKVGKKKYLVNGVSKRAFDFVGNLRAVYFGPEDLQMITGSPSLRRKYLEMVLYQVDSEYVRASLSYEKGLRSRNKILEDMKETGITDRRRLFFWDQLLIKNGNILTNKREEYINFLNSRESFEGDGVHPEGSPRGGYGIEYDRSTISEERLKQYEDVEVAAGMTLVGPHRDDFIIRVKDLPAGKAGQESERAGVARDLSAYGSRGEQRLGILWLKLGELAYIKEKTQDLPVLLLDDIFSELDHGHRKLVLDTIGDQQTIITSADIETVEKDWIEKVYMILLK